LNKNHLELIWEQVDNEKSTQRNGGSCAVQL
jgi:hypothetical protein